LRKISFRIACQNQLMLETSARLLRLLVLLQSKRSWSGGELAERLDVTTRTVRADVERLRRLGYPVGARPGVAGGYELGSGGRLPPLLLDDDEAVAITVALRTVAVGALAGLDQPAVQALTKLTQLTPTRLRSRIVALSESLLAVPSRAPDVDPDILITVATAARDHEQLRFDYRSHAGGVNRRLAEPYRLVNHRRRWYLFAWDVDRQDWRTFRVDRMAPRTPNGRRFTPRSLPSDREISDRIARGVAQAPWRYRAMVTVHAPEHVVRSRLPLPIDLQVLDDTRCVVELGSDDPAALAMHLVMLDADFTIESAPELVEAVAALAGRLQRAVDLSTS
jgi:predicted DNA-binding transcriptional regulator YafY